MKELKRYKEELAAIGLLSIVLLLIRWVSSSIWPTTGQYDLAAQTETVFFVVLRNVLYSLAAWMGLRLVAPKVYNHLKHRLNDKFDTLTESEKNSFALRMYAILFFGLIGLAVAGAPVTGNVSSVRTCVVDAAMSDVGVREATGRNDGPAVERYLAHVGLGKGNAWCAAFVSYHLSGCGVTNPLSAWSPAYASVANRVWTPRKASRSPLAGDVFSIYYPNLKRVGHVGFVRGVEGKYLLTIEGNTSGPGSREGDGVYARKRELAKIHAITSYIKASPGDPRGARSSSVRNGRMQTQTAAGADLNHRGAHRERKRHYSARYERGDTTIARIGFGGTTGTWSGLATRYHSLRKGMERRGDHQWSTASQRRLRFIFDGHPSVRPLVQAVRHTHGVEGDIAHRAGRSSLHTEVGVVVTAARPCRCRETAMAYRGQAPQVPQTPVLA